jgi:hypothetical protein
MAIPMRSTDFRSIVEPILNEEFDGVYEQRQDEWRGPMREQTGIPRNYHEEPVLFGFSAAPELPDGSPVTYQAGGVLYMKRYQYRVWGLAFALTQVLVEDGDHIRIGQIYARHLSQSLVETKELLGANVWNRAFNSAYPTGDGVAFVSASHPIVNGTFSNVLSTAAALSQTSVEQLLVQVRQAVDNNQKRIRLMPRALTCAPANVFQAEVILKSALRTGTSNNDVNPVQTMGLLKEGQYNMSRLTSATAWFINTDAPEGAKMMMRRGLKRSMEGDFETDTMRYKSTERYVPGVTDPRCAFGTPGLAVALSLGASIAITLAHAFAGGLFSLFT